MKNQKVETSMLNEMADLKKKFEVLKKDTEAFVTSAKQLSDTGTQEARELMDAVKKNWNNLMASWDGTPVAKFFSKAAKKPAVKSAKATAKKTVKKAAKKVRRVAQAH